MTELDRVFLNKNKWVEFNSDSSDKTLISIATSVGEILNHPNGQKIFDLKPKHSEGSGKGTFSDKYGLESFPFHTDTAFLKKPARFILMHLSEPSPCSTTLISKEIFWNLLDQKDRSNAARAIYRIKTNKEIYYTSFLFRENDEEGFKYDPLCMKPFNNYAKAFDRTFQDVLNSMKPQKVEWSGSKTILIDNWHCMHGRDSAKNDINRVLKRIYIN